MDKSILVKLFGFKAALIHGDTLILDRWVWMKKRLKPVSNHCKVLDVGCGTGAFTIGLAKMGYHALGLSWDQRNQNAAKERARMCKAQNAKFEIQDVRNLDQRKDLVAQFDVILCFENIEHILNDQKLMNDMAACLKKGGRLLLTTPNYNYIPITKEDKGPFKPVETGWHVRKGYTANDLEKLCAGAGLQVEEIGFCSGFISQKVTFIYRKLKERSLVLSFLCMLPFRPLPLIFDKLLSQILRYPGFSICLDAYKR